MRFKCLCGKDRYIRKRLNQKGWSERIESCSSCGLKIESSFVNGRFGNSNVCFTQKTFQPPFVCCNKCSNKRTSHPLVYAHNTNELRQVTSIYTYCSNCENKGEHLFGVDIKDLSRYLYIFTKRGKYIYFED